MQRNSTVVSTRFPDAQQTTSFVLPGLYYRSNFRLFGYFQSVIHLNTKVAHRALQLGMAKQQLHCPKIFCPPVD